MNYLEKHEEKVKVVLQHAILQTPDLTETGSPVWQVDLASLSTGSRGLLFPLVVTSCTG